jgi:hypothetical protein
VTGSYLSLLLLQSVKYKPIKEDLIDIYHNPNCYGIFRSKFGKVTAFYVSATELTPKINNHMPGGSTQFVRELVATIQMRATTITTDTTTNLISTTVSMPQPPPVEADNAEKQECRPQKKARWWMSLPTEQEPQQQARFNDGQFGSTTNLRKRKATKTTTTDSDTTTTTAESDAAPSPPANVAANEILNQDFFDLPEANILFGMIRDAPREEEDVSVRMIIEQCIKKLTEAFSTPDGWKCVLDDQDSCQTCTPFQIYNIQMKCRYIAIALQVALRKMGQGAGGVTWLECCTQAMHTVNDFNNTTYIKFHRTIQQWHLPSYRCFPNQNSHKKDGKAKLPRLLEENPDLKDTIIYYARDHLHELSASLLFQYLHEEALPALVEKKKEELKNQQYSKDDLLVDHQLGILTLRTVYKWIERLGFRYQPQMKCYYVVGHEKPEVIVYRRNFVRL